MAIFNREQFAIKFVLIQIGAFLQQELVKRIVRINFIKVIMEEFADNVMMLQLDALVEELRTVMNARRVIIFI